MPAELAERAELWQHLVRHSDEERIYTELYNFERFGIPFHEGGRYFWSRNDGLQQQNVYYTAQSLKDTPVIALDPNLLSKDGTVALTGTTPSRVTSHGR